MDLMIDGVSLAVNTEQTRRFYLTQSKITEDCDCSDCAYYSEKFISYQFEIFKILTDSGVDIRKNLNSEPTGVWCVRDEIGNAIHCDQAYKIVGRINSDIKNELYYSKIESGYRVSARFSQYESDCIYVALTIDRVSEVKGN